MKVYRFDGILYDDESKATKALIDKHILFQDAIDAYDKARLPNIYSLEKIKSKTKRTLPRFSLYKGDTHYFFEVEYVKVN